MFFMSGFLWTGDYLAADGFTPVLHYYFSSDHLFREAYNAVFFCSQLPAIGMTLSNNLHMLNLGNPWVSASRMALKS